MPCNQITSIDYSLNNSWTVSYPVDSIPKTLKIKIIVIMVGARHPKKILYFKQLWLAKFSNLKLYIHFIYWACRLTPHPQRSFLVIFYTFGLATWFNRDVPTLIGSGQHQPTHHNGVPGLSGYKTCTSREFYKLLECIHLVISGIYPMFRLVWECSLF